MINADLSYLSIYLSNPHLSQTYWHVCIFAYRHLQYSDSGNTPNINKLGTLNFSRQRGQG